MSGGLTPGDRRTECAMIKQGMVANGVPTERILEEQRATNTGENVVFSLPVIDAAPGCSNVRSVICLGKICIARRYPMTLHRHWPEVAKMLVTINPYESSAERWHDDPAFRDRVMLEWRKIELNGRRPEGRRSRTTPVADFSPAYPARVRCRRSAVYSVQSVPGSDGASV